jgi:hypothetical protein
LKTIFYKNLKAFTLCAGFFSLAACKEKNSIKPGKLIPDVDNINTFEVNDFAMSIRNAYFDSLQTNDYNYPMVGVGRISNDAFFGKTTAGAYIQFIPPSANFTFPQGIVLDSAVLSVPHSGFYYADSNKNASTLMHFKAYQITDNFPRGDASTRYYTFTQLRYNTSAIGSATVSLKSIKDTVVLSNTNRDTVSELLRFRLDNTFANGFIQAPSANFASASAFISFFQGIYLGPDTNQTQNTLGYFVLAGGNATSIYSEAHMEFYYHTNTDPAVKRVFFPFVKESCAFYNSIQRNYTGVPALSYFQTPAATRDSLLIQSYPGFRSDLTLKIDDKIPASVINKATLTLTALKTGEDTRFSPPLQLITTGINSDGSERALEDMRDNTGAGNNGFLKFVDGTAKTVKIGGVDYIQYTINLPREVQRAVSEGKKEIKLRISSAITYPGSFRLVAGGPNAAGDTKLRFNVIYTKLN